MRWVDVHGFRSIRGARLDLSPGVANVLMGLNDHGKSNFLRAVHLFFTGKVEPAVPFEFERDFCTGLRGKKGQRQQIIVEVGLSADVIHPNLLSSIKRKRILSTEDVSVRRIWRRGGVQAALVVKRPGTARVYSVPDEGNASMPGEAGAIPAHAPIRFSKEMDRLLTRFRVHYLPSNKAASSFEAIGLSTAVKRYLFDPYARSQSFAALGETLNSLRNQLQTVVKENLGDRVARGLAGQFPGISAASITLPEKQEELVQTGEVAVVRKSVPVPLSTCGSGLQSLLILELLLFLDSQAVRRGYELEPRFIWLIEEPEAFLYEDLIEYVGHMLSRVAAQSSFTVLCTSHSRDAALAARGHVTWIALQASGTDVVAKFDLRKGDAEVDLFVEHSRSQLGTGAIEYQLRELVERIRTDQSAATHRLLCVEGKSDKEVIERLIEVCKDGRTPDIKVLAPITGSQNAEHVKHSVLALSELPRTYVVGLFDNDYEGVGRHVSLADELKRAGRGNAKATLLPSPPTCRKVPTGYLSLQDNKPVTLATGHDVDLTGKSLTIEALYDDPEIDQELKSQGLRQEHWVAKPLPKGKLAYTNMPDESCKTRAAKIVIERLSKTRCGSLKLLFDQIVEDFRTLENRAGDT